MLTQDDREVRRRMIARSTRQSRATLLESQAALLRRVIRHTAENVPLYEDIYRRHGVNIAEIRTVQDLQRLPIITRESLQGARAEDVVSRGVPAASLRQHTSSGSTGMPLTTRRTVMEQELYDWVARRTNALLSPSFRGQVVYVGLNFRVFTEAPTPASPRATAVPEYPRLSRREANSPIETAPAVPIVMVDCRQPIEAIIRAVIAAKPDVIMGYPGALEDLARLASPVQLERMRPRLIASCGEVLATETRRTLEERFRVPVTSLYGSTECAWLGSECAHSAEFHLIDDSVIVEVVNAAGEPVAPGERGNVVVTALHSLAQPYVRYAIGDIAVQGLHPVGGDEGCACGAPWSTLGEVSGRVVEHLTLPDGTRVHGYTLAIPLRDKAHFLSQYQIVQERLDLVTVRMRYKAPPSAAALSALRSQLTEYLPGVTLEFAEVSHIEREPSGKYRAVVALR